MLLSYLEYHPFWSNDLIQNEVNKTVFISDPTSASTPVGVDFYEIGEQGKQLAVSWEFVHHAPRSELHLIVLFCHVGEQYGPFGVLYPMQNPPGRGYFQCIGS